MKIHRFIRDFDLSQDVVEITDEELINQIRKVLKLELGEKIILCNGKNDEITGELVDISKTLVRVRKLQKNKSEKTNQKKVRLYLAILKKENFELAIQKAVECGVSEIQPMITERTIKTGLNEERLKKIILEACEQSGRSIVPTLLETINFKDALSRGALDSASLKSTEEKILFDKSGSEYRPDKNAASANIFVGPEGGFTENEISLAKQNSFKIYSLGPLTLRAETAAIVATYNISRNI